MTLPRDQSRIGAISYQSCGKHNGYTTLSLKESGAVCFQAVVLILGLRILAESGENLVVVLS